MNHRCSKAGPAGCGWRVVRAALGSTIEVWGIMCDDCVGVGPTITRRQMLWTPPAALGAALLADAPAYGAERTIARICRSSWGGRPATGAYIPHEISRITVHHSAVALRDNRKAPAQLRSFQTDHQSRGWVDIAYHMLIDRAATSTWGDPCRPPATPTPATTRPGTPARTGARQLPGAGHLRGSAQHDGQ